jgi:hypothetical protein
MCNHVSAVLYGVGARLDEKPQLLFVLRGVDENELIAAAGHDLALSRAIPAAAKVLNDTDVAALFGLEMADTNSGGTDASKRKRSKLSKTASKRLKRSRPRETKQAAQKRQGRRGAGNKPAQRGSWSRPEPTSVLLVPRKRGAPMDGLTAPRDVCARQRSLVRNLLNSFEFSNGYGPPDSWFESGSLRHELSI